MVRIGIAGIGYIAEEYIKLIVKQRITGCSLCAVSSRNLQHMETVRKKYGLEQTALFTDYQEMLDSGCIDAVLICTPHFFHIAMAEAALAAGVHVLIEKPAGVFTEEGERIVQSVKSHPELTAGVLYCRRTSKAYRRVQSMVASRDLGKIKRASWLLTNLYRTPAYYNAQEWKGTWKGEGGGLLLTQASHQLDVLVWLLGMPEELQAFCSYGVERQIEVENEAVIQMWYPGGATVQFIASARECPGTNRLEISGSRGQIILENDRHMIWRRLEQDEREYAESSREVYGTVPYTERTLEFDGAENTVQQAAIVNNFIRAVQGKEQILCPAEEALQSLQMINGAYLSSWRGEKIRFPIDATEYRKEWERHCG
ncbi:Gfo/Idh/MocA family protein [Wansuia hejianensis]|uniref:Gfo/Idh/MocA family oxidoreductase n=1 Tax=Wansuia hejianensis TaxID=2763667 RepID=A0A7G9GH81_9FIRM|nr:Gfo/Idh/MocA family oxidoreductase [Wansuia hejianensis]QNM10163.1 Gfo/Idh/MocA family oxidoreductase [Wansuia hejianensis]RHV86185.1 gfo/Idh/MocA family oxidoreductase [Lachnospiraceae bacterium OF09-33XD]